jgi:hypothetical protein
LSTKVLDFGTDEDVMMLVDEEVDSCADAAPLLVLAAAATTMSALR